MKVVATKEKRGDPSAAGMKMATAGKTQSRRKRIRPPEDRSGAGRGRGGSGAAELRRRCWLQRSRLRGDGDGGNGVELVAMVAAAVGRRRQHGGWSTETAAAGGCGNGVHSRRPHLAGVVVIGGVGGRLGAERRSRWQWRLVRRERRGRWRGGPLGARGVTDGGRPNWRERRVRWWRPA
uniref:Uncharacterized protein n=1 Tax=Oryza nivara TaxID=4536 RepID=A0A0E0G3T1_ORYNI